ncbi:HicB family protein [Streptosporangium canum]|uniref:HicB family protein n=2 Tax=Streptosporangium canum TaxID=324952 RepID=A0A1I3Z9H0_9ACTN|nr:HicB family protein [Streptosporangium canum]
MLMDVTPFVENLRRALVASAAVAAPETRAAVENLTTALDSAVRLTLIDALSAAADEVTRELAPGSVEIRIRNREPEFVVTPPPAADAFTPSFPPPPPGPPPLPTPPEPPLPPGEAGTARLTLRMPESLKGRIEEAASQEGVSVNAWLVRAVSTALTGAPRESRSSTTGKRINGWAR